MIELFTKIKNQINHMIWSLLSTGIILLLLSILIVWTTFMLRLVFGIFVLVVAYVFIYGAYKLWVLKKDIEKHFNI